MVATLFISVNTLRPRQNGRHSTDDIFKCIFLNENVWILLKISLKFVLKGPINNIPSLVQIMAWRRPGDKPLSEPMMVRLPTYICVTRPQWVNSSHPSAAYMLTELGQLWLRWWLVAYSAPSHYLSIVEILSIGPLGTTFTEILIKRQNFSFMEMHRKISSAKSRPFCPRGDELMTFQMGEVAYLG